MRKPVNRGTRKNPRWTGSVRHQGVERWVPGSYPTAALWTQAAKIVQEQIENEKIKPETRTVAAYVGTQEHSPWIEMNPRRKTVTGEDLIRNVRPFVQEFGDLTFDEINKHEARLWMVGRSKNQVKSARVLWNNARTDHIADGVNALAKPGIQETGGRKDITVLTVEDVELLAATAKEVYPGLYGRMFSALIIFLAYTAVRPGEAAGARWAMMHPEKREGRIETTVDRRGREESTKTVKGERDIVIPRRAAQALDDCPTLDSLRVFTTKRGKPIRKSGFHYYFTPVRVAFMAKLPQDHQLHVRIAKCIEEGIDPAKAKEGKGHFHLYELRHFGITRLLELGKWRNIMGVCEQVGHRNPELLYSTYGHPDKVAALQKLKELDDEQPPISSADVVTPTDEDLHQFIAGD